MFLPLFPKFLFTLKMSLFKIRNDSGLEIASIREQISLINTENDTEESEVDNVQSALGLSSGDTQFTFTGAFLSPSTGSLDNIVQQVINNVGLTGIEGFVANMGSITLAADTSSVDVTSNVTSAMSTLGINLAASTNSTTAGVVTESGNNICSIKNSSGVPIFNNAVANIHSDFTDRDVWNWTFNSTHLLLLLVHIMMLV